MKNSQLSMMSLCLMVALSACSVESKVDGGLLPVPGPGPAPSKVAVEGTWKSGCTSQDGFFQIEEMVFAGEDFHTTARLYQNSTCSGTPMFEAKVDGTFKVVAASLAVIGGTDVDVTMADPQTGQVGKYMLVVLVENGKLYLPPTNHDSKASRATSVDFTKPYSKVGG